MIDASDLKNDLISIFSDFGNEYDCQIHDGIDFVENREADNVLAVVVTTIREANIGLPDYFVDVQLILDCRINQDDAVEVYEALAKELADKVHRLTARGEDIRSKFTSPVVGMSQATEFSRTIGGDSNIVNVVMHFVLSYSE